MSSTFSPSTDLSSLYGDDTEPDVDLDLDPSDDDDDDDDETGADALILDDPSPSATKSPVARGLTRGAIRRIASKAQEITTTEERITTIAANLLGVGTGLSDLTTAIMASPRSVTAPINDLNAIADSDPMEAGVNAAAMGRERIKAVWSLLASLDAGSKGAMPGANAKAAIAVAKAVFALDDIAKAEIAAVATLLKKN